jgi:hypothetical protein
MCFVRRALSDLGRDTPRWSHHFPFWVGLRSRLDLGIEGLHVETSVPVLLLLPHVGCIDRPLPLQGLRALTTGHYNPCFAYDEKKILPVSSVGS